MTAPVRPGTILPLPVQQYHPYSSYGPSPRPDTVNGYSQSIASRWQPPPQSPYTQYPVLPRIHDRPISPLVASSVPTASTSPVPGAATGICDTTWHMFQDLFESCHRAHVKLSETLESVASTAENHGLKIDALQNMSEHTADQFRMARNDQAELLERIRALQEKSEQNAEAVRRQASSMQDSSLDIWTKLSDIRIEESGIKREQAEIKEILHERRTDSTEIKGRLERLEEKSFTAEDVRDTVRSVFREFALANCKAAEERRMAFQIEFQNGNEKILKSQETLASTTGHTMESMKRQILRSQEQFANRIDGMEENIVRCHEQFANRIAKTEENVSKSQERAADRLDRMEEKMLKDQRHLTDRSNNMNLRILKSQEKFVDQMDGLNQQILSHKEPIMDMVNSINEHVLPFQGQFASRIEKVEGDILEDQKQLEKTVTDMVDRMSDQTSQSQERLASLVMARMDETSEQATKGQKQLANLAIGIDGFLISIDQQIKDVVCGVESTNESIKTRMDNHHLPPRDIRDHSTQTWSKLEGHPTRSSSRTLGVYARGSWSPCREPGNMNSTCAGHNARNLKLSKIFSIGEAPCEVTTNVGLPEHNQAPEGGLFLREAFSNCTESILSLVRATRQNNEILESVRGEAVPEHKDTSALMILDSDEKPTSAGNEEDEDGRDEKNNLGLSLADEIGGSHNKEATARVDDAHSQSLDGHVAEVQDGDNDLNDNDEPNDSNSFKDQDAADGTLGHLETQDQSTRISPVHLASILRKRAKDVRELSLHESVKSLLKDNSPDVNKPQSKKPKGITGSSESLQLSTMTVSKREDKGESNLENRSRPMKGNNGKDLGKKKKMKRLSEKRAAKQQKNMPSAILKKKDKALSSSSIPGSDVGGANWHHKKRKRSEGQPKSTDQQKRKKVKTTR